MKDAPSSAIAQLDKVQNQFIGINRNPKLKHTTLCNEYERRRTKTCGYLFQKKQISNIRGFNDYMMTNFLPGK